MVSRTTNDSPIGDVHYAHQSAIKFQEYAVKGAAVALDPYIATDKNFKLAGSYPLPWQITASAVFQTVPGLPRNITYVVTRAQVPQLTLSSVTVPLSAPGEQ